MNDWNPRIYQEYSELRLRPALDLLAAVGDLPPGEIKDLGCGTGVVGPFLADRFPDHALFGLEHSPAMREAACALDVYTDIETGDISTHDLGSDLAMIYSNAALNWVPDHRTLLPGLMQRLAPGGWFAMQVPYQHDAPSHALARVVANRLAPDAFPDTDATPHVLPPRSYASVLAPFGEPRVWMTEYMQEVSADEGHPVRHFTQATYLRPYLDHFEGLGRLEEFISAYDTELGAAYPVDSRGFAWLPFKRLFVTLKKS